MSDKKIIHVGSSIEKAEKGEYHLDVSAILKEGWLITKKHNTPILAGLLLVMLIGVIAISFIASYWGGPEQMLQNPEANMIGNLILTVIVWPFLAGVEMMGVSHALGMKTRAGMVFGFLKRSAFIALTALIVWALTSLGMILIIPGIYIAVALSLVIPLVVEKNMSPARAIALSFKATRFQWFKLFQIYMSLLALALIALLPSLLGMPSLISLAILLVGFLVIAPLYYNVKGVLYREIFGVTMQVVNKDGQPDSYFSA
ncbi:hypothetical protein QWY77_01185 [Thalassotalea ponticola]|uniref:hypothetical protein n=1 Tax=Thalassotalea ponticola TaxID=1523392 RepID=UPI0025B2938D|nr:hypothetical protein [Thalassotalea ponticola]MDN3651399.1 hypothetical protein [Thalassotalea ponticola]